MIPFKKLGNFIRIGDIVKVKYFTVAKKKRKLFEVIGLCYYKTKKTLYLKFSCSLEPVIIYFDINTPFLIYIYRLYAGTPVNVKRTTHTYKNSFFRFTDFGFLNNLLRKIYFGAGDTSLLNYYKSFTNKTAKNMLQLAKLDRRSMFRIKKKYRI